MLDERFGYYGCDVFMTNVGLGMYERMGHWRAGASQPRRRNWPIFLY